MSSSSGAPASGDAAASVPAEQFDPTLDWYALVTPDEGQKSHPPHPRLGPNSTLKEIKTAYRQKARDLHPDKNPDPKAAVLFHRLQRAFAALSDPAQRSAYDARIVAAATRAAKDATLDAALAGMKRDLVRREAEAAAARLAKASQTRANATSNAQSEADRTREANEKLLREMHGVMHHQSAASSSSAAGERPTKARRRDERDASVHAGSTTAGASSASEDEANETGDERARTVSVRWPKPSQTGVGGPPTPTAASLQSVLDRFGSIAHVFLKADPTKRGAFVVYDTLQGAHRAAQANERTGLPKGWTVKRMSETTGPPPTPPATSTAAAAATAALPTTAATAATPAPPSSASPSTLSTVAPTPVAAPLPLPLPVLAPLDRSKLTPAEYEAATLARMAALAKARKAQREATAAAAAKAATITIDGDAAMPQQQ